MRQATFHSSTQVRIDRTRVDKGLDCPHNIVQEGGCANEDERLVDFMVVHVHAAIVMAKFQDIWVLGVQLCF
jgi:hypothetical protein